MTTSMLSVLAWPLFFLIANVAALLAVLILNRKTVPRPASAAPPTASEQVKRGSLDASGILGWEFEYARITASEAMQDRHTMINFYLLAVGVVATGVAAVLSGDSKLPPASGTVLLWVLCGVGWLYFLKLIRLRQAWFDSARAMNQIKEFYVQHVKDFEPEELRSAFRWQKESLPPAGQLWTVFFYSATLIGLLNSVSYVVGGMLLNLNVVASSRTMLSALCLLGFVFFAFHIALYCLFLENKSLPKDAPNRGESP